MASCVPVYCFLRAGVAIILLQLTFIINTIPNSIGEFILRAVQLHDVHKVTVKFQRAASVHPYLRFCVLPDNWHHISVYAFGCCENGFVVA